MADDETPTPAAAEPAPRRFEVILPAYYTLADIRYPLPVLRVGDVVEALNPEPDLDGDILVRLPGVLTGGVALSVLREIEEED
jgi:hypothetical protein